MTETRPAGDASLNGLQKAGVLILSLETDVAARLLKVLDENLREKVTREIVSLQEVSRQSGLKVIEEFYHFALARQYVKRGGVAYARTLLQKALPFDEAQRLITEIEHAVTQAPFAFLQKTNGENLLTFIQEEHPQTIALILSHLPPGQAGAVLVGLEPAKQLEVVMRMAKMDPTNPDVVRDVEKGLESRLGGMVSQPVQRVGGVDRVAEVLNMVGHDLEKALLELIEAEDPELVEKIRRLMFVFEDILLVDDKGIQAVLKEIDNDDLALALRMASDELKKKIFSNMSERAAQLIHEEMEYMGPVRVSDVETAQQKIVDVIRRLEDAGELVIVGRGGADAVIQ